MVKPQLALYIHAASILTFFTNIIIGMISFLVFHPIFHYTVWRTPLIIGHPILDYKN